MGTASSACGTAGRIKVSSEVVRHCWTAVLK